MLLCACLAASNSTEKTLGTNTKVANRICATLCETSSAAFAANANSASPRQTELTLVSYLDTFKKCCRNAEKDIILRSSYIDDMNALLLQELHGQTPAANRLASVHAPMPCEDSEGSTISMVFLSQKGGDFN